MKVVFNIVLHGCAKISVLADIFSLMARHLMQGLKSQERDIYNLTTTVQLSISITKIETNFSDTKI